MKKNNWLFRLENASKLTNSFSLKLLLFDIVLDSKIKPPNKSLSRTMTNNISFNEEKFVTSSQSLDYSDAIEKLYSSYVKKRNALMFSIDYLLSLV